MLDVYQYNPVIDRYSILIRGAGVGTTRGPPVVERGSDSPPFYSLAGWFPP